MRGDQACPHYQPCLYPPDYHTVPGRAQPMLQVCPKPTSLGKAAPAGPPPAKQLQEGEVFWSPSKGLTLQPLLLLTTS